MFTTNICQLSPEIKSAVWAYETITFCYDFNIPRLTSQHYKGILDVLVFYFLSLESRQTNQLCSISQCDSNSLLNEVTQCYS